MPELWAPHPLHFPVEVWLEFGNNCATLGHSPPERMRPGSGYIPKIPGGDPERS